MKITKQRLKEIIKEELSSVVGEGVLTDPPRDGNGLLKYLKQLLMPHTQNLDAAVLKELNDTLAELNATINNLERAARGQ